MLSTKDTAEIKTGLAAWQWDYSNSRFAYFLAGCGYPLDRTFLGVDREEAVASIARINGRRVKRGMPGLDVRF